MNDAVTSSPNITFDPNVRLDSAFKLSFLSREIVCTENLSTFVKLLPCKSQAGIAKLLKAHKVFDGNYQSLSVHWVPKCVVFYFDFLGSRL